jgi:hypothetical protein
VNEGKTAGASIWQVTSEEQAAVGHAAKNRGALLVPEAV